MPERRPPTVVVLSVAGADAVARCLSALLPTLPADVALYAGGTDEGRAAIADLAGPRAFTWLDGEGVALWNAVVEAAPGADLILLDAATEVGPHWLEDLLAVAAAEPDAATITALSNSAAFLSAPRRNLAWPLLPPALTVAQAAQQVREGALGLHPRIPTALPHAAFVARAALELAGPFHGPSPQRALADLCVRATAAGLAHVVADEVYVAHRGALEGDLAADPAQAMAIEDAAEDRFSALSRALLATSVVLEPLGVTIDARSLGGGVTGTIVHLVEVLHALSARDDVRVRALLPAQIGDAAGRALARLSALERLTDGALPETLDRTHVVHRPWQVESAQEMAFLDALGERTVVTNQDLIGYRTPPVFDTPEHWRDYRRATAGALGLAAMVLFFSQAAADDALADDLVAPERARVVALGTRPVALELPADGTRPAALAEQARPFLLVLGNRFRHKNVRFALELLGALRDEHGWDGDLVVAGADVLHGSGSGDDAAWLLRHPEHAPHVHQLGAVGEAEKAWLLRRAAAVVYPTTYEGFGLIPFEAAAAGTPCLIAPVSALRDTLASRHALLVPWDARASAARVAPVLTEAAARVELVAAIDAAGAPLTWEATAAGLAAAYRDAVRLPAPPTARLVHEVARAEHDYWAARDGLSDATWALVRPDAGLVDDELATRLHGLLDGPGGRSRLLAALPERAGVAWRAASRVRRAAGRFYPDGR